MAVRAIIRTRDRVKLLLPGQRTLIVSQPGATIVSSQATSPVAASLADPPPRPARLKCRVAGLEAQQIVLEPGRSALSDMLLLTSTVRLLLKD